MNKSNDLTGQQFGKLTVIGYSRTHTSPTGRKYGIWTCKCDCGKVVEVSTSHLRNGHTKSCGCLKKKSQKFTDLSGQKFNRLTVIRRASNKGNITMWECLCECGNTTIVSGSHLKQGHVKSCGCYLKDNPTNLKHGETNTRLHRIWSGMKARCNNPHFEMYKYYGGRGISVCKEWSESYESFRNWALTNGYSDHLTIDRIDCDGDYEPSNCRWATVKQQANNMRSNRKIEFNGETKTMSEWAESLGINYTTLFSRIRNGWDLSRALCK